LSSATHLGLSRLAFAVEIVFSRGCACELSKSWPHMVQAAVLPGGLVVVVVGIVVLGAPVVVVRRGGHGLFEQPAPMTAVVASAPMAISARRLLHRERTSLVPPLPALNRITVSSLRRLTGPGRDPRRAASGPVRGVPRRPCLHA
jgi:hypothetical protein